MNRLFLLVLLFISITTFYLMSYTNNYGMNKDWHTVYEQKDIKDNNGHSSQRCGGIQFWDSLNGIAITGYMLPGSSPKYDTSDFTNFIYRTTNGGYKWKRILIDTTSYLRTIHSLDVFDRRLVFASHGRWTIKEHDTALYFSSISKSIDGGYTWKETKLPFVDYDKSIQIYDTDTIFACYSEHLIRTTDGGETWVDFEPNIKDFIPNEPYSFMRYADLDITDDKTILIYTKHTEGHNYIIRSTDGGNNWETILLPVTYTGSFQGITKDTFLVEGYDPVKENQWLVRVTDNGSKADTIIFYDSLRSYIGRIYTYGKEEFIIGFGNPNLYSSDGGKTIDSISDQKAYNYRKRALFFATWAQKNRMLVLAMDYGDIVMYDTNFNVNSVELNKIHNFQTKLYPNPVFAQKPLNIEIENDKLRKIRISTYNIEGVKLDMSDEVSIPRGFYSFSYQPKMLNTGTYFIVIESGGEVIAREKFIVK